MTVSTFIQLYRVVQKPPFVSLQYQTQVSTSSNNFLAYHIYILGNLQLDNV